MSAIGEPKVVQKARGGRERDQTSSERCSGSGQDRQKLEDARKKLGSCAKALRVGGLIARKTTEPRAAFGAGADGQGAGGSLEEGRRPGSGQTSSNQREREILSRILFDFFEAEAEFSVQKMIWQSLSHDPRPKVSHAKL